MNFETEICTRCGGTGNYSFNLINGSTCFKCKGKKLQYTKRGKVARDRWIAKRMETVAVVGNRYVMRVGINLKRVNVELVSVVENKFNAGRVDMVFVDRNGKECHFTMPAEMTKPYYERASTQQELEEAIAYQNTLTKAGKPGKNTPKED